MTKQWDGTIDGLVTEAHGTAVKKGWYDAERQAPELLCLVHSELSEALEEYRAHRGEREVYFGPTGKPEGFPIELADAVIRIADMCGAFDIDLAAAIQTKLEYNATRPHRHGGKKA